MDAADDTFAVGSRLTGEWGVPDRLRPGPATGAGVGRRKVWLFHSRVAEVDDTAGGAVWGARRPPADAIPFPSLPAPAPFFVGIMDVPVSFQAPADNPLPPSRCHCREGERGSRQVHPRGHPLLCIPPLASPPPPFLTPGAPLQLAAYTLGFETDVDPFLADGPGARGV